VKSRERMLGIPRPADSIRRRSDQRHRAITLGVAILLLSMAGAERSEAQGSCVFYTPPYDSDWIARPGEIRLVGTVVGARRVSVPNRTFPGLTLQAMVHEVRVDEWRGDMSGDIPAGTHITVFRWGPSDCYGGGRTPVADTFLPLGSKQVLTGVPRKPEESLAGRLTLDIGTDSHHAIPGMLGSDIESPAVWDFLTWVVPDHWEWNRDCRPGLRRVEWWLERNPGLSYPPPLRATREDET
jgi:hypothetical protein